jgi:transposase
MDVVNDDAKTGFRRIEVLTGPTRRRRWSEAEKSRIIAETLQPGVTVTEVARRWEICPQQIWGWRRQVLDGELTLAGGPAAGSPFVPIVMEPSSDAADGKPERVPERAAKRGSAACIEIHIAGAVVRARAGTDHVLLTEVLRAVRASAA